MQSWRTAWCKSLWASDTPLVVVSWHDPVHAYCVCVVFLGRTRPCASRRAVMVMVVVTVTLTMMAMVNCNFTCAECGGGAESVVVSLRGMIATVLAVLRPNRRRNSNPLPSNRYLLTLSNATGTLLSITRAPTPSVPCCMDAVCRLVHCNCQQRIWRSNSGGVLWSHGCGESWVRYVPVERAWAPWPAQPACILRAAHYVQLGQWSKIALSNQESARGHCFC